MSSVIAGPELINTAARDLANVGETISQANAAAALPTSSVVAAGADEVSAAIASLFGAHAQAYQALSAQAASFHQQFVQLMTASAGSYASAETVNAAPLNASGHIPPGLFMHTPFLPGTGIENPFFGVPPGHVMHTEFIPGTGIENPLFGVPPGHWNISLLTQAIR